MLEVADTKADVMKKSHRALIVGEGSLAEALATVLNERAIPYETCATVDSAHTCEGISLVFYAWFPTPGKDDLDVICSFPRRMLKHSLDNAAALIEAHPTPAIINFSFLPAIYVGTELEDHASSVRGAITGVTRTLARKFGKQGLRVTGVQAGLTEMPETQAWVSERVTQVVVPAKRWATPKEVAKLMAFLAVDSLYTTGQTMIIDGGLTAGVTGT